MDDTLYDFIQLIAEIASGNQLTCNEKNDIREAIGYYNGKIEKFTCEGD